MANVQLLQKTLDHIRSHPEEWEQRFWRCGAGMCFAGHAAILGGATWLTELDVTADDFDTVVMPDKTTKHPVQFAAQQLLDVTFPQADKLFSADNTFAQLEHLVEAIVRDEEVVQVPRIEELCDQATISAHP